MDLLDRLDKQTILADEIFEEIFNQEDVVCQSRMILSLETAEGLQQSQPGNQETEEAVRRNEQLYGI